MLKSNGDIIVTTMGAGSGGGSLTHRTGHKKKS
jgi:hypothetical protein